MVNTQRIQRLERLIQSQGGLPNPSEKANSTSLSLSSSPISNPLPQNVKSPTSQNVPTPKLSSKQTEALLSRKSQFSDLADEKINHDRKRKFEEMCQREAKQEELSQLHEISVKVVHCRTCDYVDETPAPMCRQLGHDLKTNVCMRRISKVILLTFLFSWKRRKDSSRAPTAGGGRVHTSPWFLSHPVWSVALLHLRR